MLLDGQDIWSDKKLTRQARFRVGLVFQYPEYQLFEETVYKDIAFGPKNMGLSAGRGRPRASGRPPGSWGLTEQQLEVSPFDLSGGQKRRVAIAGVIAMEPEVLILDEPTAGLDPVGRAEILGNIQRLPQGEERYDPDGLPLHGGRGAADGSPAGDERRPSLPWTRTPREVFTHAEELTAHGTGHTPGDTGISGAAPAGAGRDDTVYTIDQAAAEIEPARKGGNCHA